MKQVLVKQKLEATLAGLCRFRKTTELSRPLIGTEISAGFPSPAQDYIEKSLDLNELLVSHPSATFFMKVEGYSMINAGIHPGDILVVDRAEEALHKRIIIAVVDGDLTVKRLYIDKERWFLMPENEDYKPIEITDEMDFQVWGVVTYVIHKAQ